MIKSLRLNTLLLLAIISFNFYSFGANRTYIYDRWYTVDTLQCSQVGPGTKYTSIKFTAEDKSLTFRTFFLHADVDAPNVTFQAEFANDSIIGVETVRNHAQKRSKSGKYYLAGTNGDFYTTTTPVGIPINACNQNGQMGTPTTGSPNFVVSDATSPWCTTLGQSLSLKINDGSSITLNRVNGTRYTNELVLYNSLTGGYTHTGAGGKEIALELLSGEQWKINSPVKVKVIGALSETGNMAIAPGQAVLSADGTSKSVIEGLNDGDIIEFNLNQTIQNYNNATPNITQTIGGNVFLLADGNVVPQGDMARHPRTMLGYTKDRKQMIMCVLDGRSTISSGGIYLEMADIMKYAGADWAINIDGGGSSTMYINPLGIMNKPSDGTERAVSNGMYIVLNAPEDNDIASIKFMDWAMAFPKYGVYRPVFYGYNKYGMLINTDVEGVVLSCPAELGTIEGDTFIGSGNGTYPLTGTYKGFTTSIAVTVAESDNVQMRLSKVINDTYREYPVEVEAIMNEKYMPLNPAALSWSSDDNAIVQIDSDKGILKGVADGVANIHGKVGNFDGSLQVSVEKPTSRVMAMDSPMDISTWKITQTGGKNIAGAPLDNGMILTYIGASGRGPNIKLTKKVQLWSLPDTIRMRINPGDAPVKKITFNTNANENGVVNTAYSEELVANQINVVDIPTSSWCDAEDMINYPLYVNSITFDMGTSTTDKEYTIKIPGLEAVYKAADPSGVEGVTNGEKQNVVRISGNMIFTSGIAQSICVYNMAGALISETKNVSSAKLPADLNSGIVKAKIDGKVYLQKFVY